MVVYQHFHSNIFTFSQSSVAVKILLLTMYRPYSYVIDNRCLNYVSFSELLEISVLSLSSPFLRKMMDPVCTLPFPSPLR